ncbi:MAG TPA: hypothetical protein DCY71_09765 [Clostridiaceae bacterium]|nr:hypothetical protein [Clostridiaceae bacterium]
MINNFHISDKKCIFDVHSRPTIENNNLSSHFIEAPVGRCGFDLRAFFIIMDTTKETEVWKEINGYEGYYQVSDLGRVRSLDRVITYKSGASKLLKGSVLNPTMNNGYKHVTLTIKGRQKAFKISQLVAIGFLGHKPDGYKLVVDHINGNRSDDRVENLRIVTNRANASTCFRTGNGTFSSKYVGVCWSNRSLKWQSSIYYDGINIYLGLFDNEIDASDAYQKALSKIKNGSFNPNDYKPKYSSKYKGVNLDKRVNKWMARITIKGSRKFLGQFKTEEEAYEARQKALKEYNL